MSEAPEHKIPVRASLDLDTMLENCLKHTRENKNAADIQPGRWLRFQILFDGVGFYRGGRMATRFGARIVDMLAFFNAPYYFANIALMLTGDKYNELSTYLRHIWDKLNAGLTREKTGKDEKGKDEFTSCLHIRIAQSLVIH